MATNDPDVHKVPQVPVMCATPDESHSNINIATPSCSHWEKKDIIPEEKKYDSDDSDIAIVFVRGSGKVKRVSEKKCKMSSAYQPELKNITPSPPEPPYPPVPKSKLSPLTALICLKNKEEAFSLELQTFCLSHPISVIRGLTSVLKLDLCLFTTETLAKANPNHNIEVKTQSRQSSNETSNAGRERQVWHCESHSSHTTIDSYAQYQESLISKLLTEEQEKAQSGHTTLETDGASTSSVSRRENSECFKSIKFGTNVDLSDKKKWRSQLEELEKLPTFLKIASPGNMLSHVGLAILETVQLHMNVPGSKTPGHQENNNFCSVNINIGPGDCEWFGVPESYWGVMHKMCERNGLSFLHDSWWPILDELSAENIPVYHFLQRPGDLVWVNAGTVYWVQAISWCNNITWNVGPLTANQFRLSMERYEWNKIQHYKSKVPMIHLAWNLARNLKLSDQKLFDQIKDCLLHSLEQCQMTLNFLEELKKEVKWLGREYIENVHYCTDCEVEVFNLLFMKKVNKMYLVNCVNCAKKCNAILTTFIVYEQFKIQDMRAVYDNFILHHVPHSESLV